MSTRELEIRRLHDTNRRVEITQQSRPRFEQVYEQLSEAALPPCVINDESWEIRHVFGDVGPFLRLPVGKIDLNISRMAKGDLSIPLGTAIQSAAAEKVPGEPVSDFVHRITHPGGKTVTLRINGSPIVDEYGEVEGAVFNIEETEKP